MKHVYKNTTIRVITVLMLLSLPFLGSDCEDIINQINNPPTGDIAGTWVLIYNAGTTNDICPGETVDFPSTSGGTATLTCPQQSSISRNYTVSGTTLTYTESGIQYEIGFTQNNELVLAGINNNRILYYSSVPSDGKPNVKYEKDIHSRSNSSSSNSSEIK